MLSGRPFYAIGANSYFLENIAALGDTVHVIEVFREARNLGITTMRTWGFFDCEDSALLPGLQWGPEKFNENGLRALDYVVAKASEYSIKLIIPFVNNWDDYGGMNQYVQWYADRLPSTLGKSLEMPQRIVQGTDGRFYRFVVTDTLTHDHFYTLPAVRQWYRSYVSMLLNRTNSVSGWRYMNDPNILAWELANEPRSSDASGGIVAGWMEEMSSFIKSIDTNHLVSTGEEGLETPGSGFRSSDYNDQSWLFDGSGGTSFRQNISLRNIDIAGIHCYPSAWGISLNGGIQWLRDHQEMADRVQKPLIVGEVGEKRSGAFLYNALFNEGLYGGTNGIVLWQLVYSGRTKNDGYAFSCPDDEDICGLIERSADRFDRKGIEPIADTDEVSLETFPNPFNGITIVSYALKFPVSIQLRVFNALGQQIECLVDGIQPSGVHFSLFDGSELSTGSYFVRLAVNDVVTVRRIVLLR